MERLLITGIDYPLGSNLALRLSEQCEVLGVSSHFLVESPYLRSEAWRPGDWGAIKELIQGWHPHWIVHCGPLSDSSWEVLGNVESLAHEPQVVAHLARLAAEQSARLTVLSSDTVFTGPRMFHGESSPAFSSSARALQVRAMERALESTDALVVRTHAYGWSSVAATASFAQQVHEMLSSGGSIQASGLHYATPILATDLADLLWRAYELGLRGLYHLAGAERTSSFRFVSELASAFGLHFPLEVRKPRETTARTEHDETSLDSKRARRVLEMSTPMLREGLHCFVEQTQNGWRDGWCVTGPIFGQTEIAA